MNTVINLLVMAFILFMAYWWGRQGLFSAFLHFIITVACGAIALALWEPISQGILLMRIPQFAWGVGLLAPFVLALLIVRTVIDKVVHYNLYFSTLTNWIGGSIFGFLSGCLTVGLTIIGLGFLALPADLMGYQPYYVDASGQVMENSGGRLWFSVEKSTDAFYSMLSRGSFYAGQPMDLYAPSISTQAGMFRLRYDPNSAVAVAPGEVVPMAVYVVPTPLKGADATVTRLIGNWARQSNSKLVVVETKWAPLEDQKARAFDTNLLRLYPPAIRLLTVETGKNPEDSTTGWVAPVGATKVDPGTGERLYVPFSDNKAFLSADTRGGTFAFVFQLPQDQEPKFLFTRRLRLSLPEASSDMHRVARALGKSTATSLVGENNDSVTGRVGMREGTVSGSQALGIEINNALPYVISRNKVTSFEVDANGFLTRGIGEAGKTEGTVSKQVAIERIHTDPTVRTVRVRLGKDKAQSLMGAAHVAAASVQGVWLQDVQGNKYLPQGFAWARADGSQQIHYEPESPIQSARQIPTNQMGPDDLMYLYFAIPKGVKIATFHASQSMKQAAELDVK